MTPTEIDLTFRDSHTDESGWAHFDPDSLEDFQPIRVRGYLVHEDDTWLVVATAVNECGYSLGRLIVPKMAVLGESRS